MNTLLLATDTWDLITDANGNMAMATAPYAIAQDVASAVKLFARELWYDTTQGISYFENILGKRPPLQYVKAQVEKAALTVPEVVTARCLFAGFKGRALSGQIQIIDKTGASHNVHF
jgi:hypothetical protein